MTAIATGNDGRVQLRFTDGAIISLQPGTRFRIEEYQYKGSSQRGIFSLFRGALRTTSGAIGKRSPSDYEMRTPTATIGIRGTEYIAEFTVCEPACTPGPQAGLRVAVSEGVIAVSNPAGEVRVAQGQAAGASSLTSSPTLIDSRPTLQPRTLNPQGVPQLARAPIRPQKAPRKAPKIVPLIAPQIAAQISTQIRSAIQQLSLAKRYQASPHLQINCRAASEPG